MKNDISEKFFYDKIGQLVIDSIPVETWDRALLTIFYSQYGTIDINGNCYEGDKIIPLMFPEYFILEEIHAFKKYTLKNNFKAWNKLEFRMLKSFNVNVKYIFDDNYHQIQADLNNNNLKK